MDRNFNMLTVNGFRRSKNKNRYVLSVKRAANTILVWLHLELHKSRVRV